jgi:hypothetical protein
MWNDNENVLGFDPLSPDPRASLGGALVLAGEGSKATGDALDVWKGIQRQEVRIDATAQKTIYAMNRLAEIDQHAVVAFSEALKSIARVVDRANGESYSAYMKAFGDRQVKLMARHNFGLAELGATEIARLVHQLPTVDQVGGIWGIFYRLLNPVA